MIKDFFELIRWKSILLVAITLIIVRVFIHDCFYEVFELSPALSIPFYALFVLSVVLLVVSCSIADEIINKDKYKSIRDGKSFIGTLLQEQTAKVLCIVLLVLSLATAYTIGALNGFVHLGTILIVLFGMMYFCSKRYSFQPVAGKLLRALCQALLFLLPTMFETACLANEPKLFEAIGQQNVMIMMLMSLCFGGFAFILSLLTEITADLRDIDDAKQINSRSFALYFGEDATKKTTYFLVVLLIAATAFFQFRYYQADKMIVLGGISILIYLPLLYFIKEMRSAKSVQDYDFLVKLLNMVFISLLFAMTSLKYVIPYALI